MRFFGVSGLLATVPLLMIAPGAAAPASAQNRPHTRELSDVPSAPRRVPAPVPMRPASAVIPSTPAPAGADDLQLIPPWRRPAPSPIPADLEWLGKVPMTLEMFKGQVVLIEVWESSCINCVRSLPVLSALQSRYRNYGFLVIGVHSPEFAFTANRLAVERAVRRFGLEFPVASDTHQTFWKSWEVRGWPTTFLLDVHGLIANLHQGEVPSAQMERSIRALLRERDPRLVFPPIAAAASSRDAFAPECGFVTPDILTEPGLDFLLNPGGFKRGETVVYADPGLARSEGTFFLRGPWMWLHNGLQRGATPEAASIGITYTAKEVYAVIANTGAAGQLIEIRQDGRPLTESNRGSDIVIAKDGRSFLQLMESRIHYLVVNSDVGRHDLELFPPSSNFQIHSFSFGNRCQTQFPHR